MKKTFIVTCLIAAAGLMAAPRLPAQSAGTLQDVTFSQVEGKTVFLIKVDGDFTYESSSLTMPRRLVIDLTPVEKIAAAPFLQVNTSGVTSVRIGQIKPQTVRVVFDLNDQDHAPSVSMSPGGLMVTFLLESAPPAAREAERMAPVREIPREEVSRTGSETAPVGDLHRRFFFRVAGGSRLFLKPNLTSHREFALYGETGAVDETYNLNNALVFEGRLGQFFRLGASHIKAGVDFTFWTLPVDGSFILTVPHPFLANAPRTVRFSETAGLKRNEISFYIFALFPLIESKNFSIFLGPLLGYASGKFRTLSDWDLTEKAPFTSADVTMSNPVYYEDTISGLLYGVSLSMEVNLGHSLALVLDTKLNYLNPKLTNLGKRANLLNIQPTLGIQFSF